MTERFGNSLPWSKQDAKRFTGIAQWSSPASFSRTGSLCMRLCSWKKGVCRMPNLICDYRQKHLIWIIGLSFICREYWLSQLVQKERVERGKLLLKAKFSNSLKIHHTLFFCKLLNLNIHCKTALLVTLSSKRNYSLQYHIDSPAAMQSLFAVPKLQQNSSSFIMKSKACTIHIL